jgi:ABC-type multidrug transport system ATPase subunit
MVILGRSGSGKTVLTSMLVGLNTPDKGVITVAGPL